jgi:hypothetical protein
MEPLVYGLNESKQMRSKASSQSSFDFQIDKAVNLSWPGLLAISFHLPNA